MTFQANLSKNFIKSAKNKFKLKNARFYYSNASKYLSDNIFDYIFIIGLITYLNDDEIRELSSNCAKMLNFKGKIILRSVSINDENCDRKVYKYHPNLFKRLLGKKGYQIIRRSTKQELILFDEFNLISKEKINGTGYNLYTLRKKL